MEIPQERLTMRELFLQACAKSDWFNALGTEERNTIARRIERDCFNRTVLGSIEDGIDRRWSCPKFVERYSTECYRILSNLDGTSSVNSFYLIREIVAGNIDPSKLTELSNYELCPSASQAERDEIELRLRQKVDIKVSRAYICRKCHKNETQLRRYQGRAADEDSSLSIKCINCGFIWRM